MSPLWRAYANLYFPSILYFHLYIKMHKCAYYEVMQCWYGEQKLKKHICEIIQISAIIHYKMLFYHLLCSVIFCNFFYKCSWVFKKKSICFVFEKNHFLCFGKIKIKVIYGPVRVLNFIISKRRLQPVGASYTLNKSQI